MKKSCFRCIKIGNKGRKDSQKSYSKSQFLMEHAGYIRQLSSGLYCILPLMVRSLQKLSDIIREELVKIGAAESVVPLIQPKSLWDQTGRWETYTQKNILFTSEDREGKHYCLVPTAEEAYTHLLASEQTPNEAFPIILFQIKEKFRDEIRPRYGLLRAKEFIMKDAYAFCTSEEQMREVYSSMRSAYVAILERLQLKYVIAEAAGGDIVSDQPSSPDEDISTKKIVRNTEEFQVLAPTGEDDILYTKDFYVNVEK